jgi:ribose transport system permease protein
LESFDFQYETRHNEQARRRASSEAIKADLRAIQGFPKLREFRRKKIAMPKSSSLKTLSGHVEKYGLIGAFVILLLVFNAAAPGRFLTWSNVSSVLGSQAVLVVLTLSLVITLATDMYDLSAASVLVFSNMLIAVLNVNLGVPIGWALAAALVVGVVVGWVNSFFIIRIGINSLIVTLGVGTILNGFTLWISDSQTISGISDQLVNFVVVYRLFGIPMEFFYGLIACIVLWYVMDFTAIGRRLLFVGRSRQVARLSGIKVERVQRNALIAAGVLNAFAGILYSGTTGAADPGSGLTFLLPAMAAAFFGSTSIVPGRFNPWGSLIAVYFLAFGISGVTIQGVQTYVQNLFYGGALVIAVTLSQLVKRRKEVG